MIQVRLSIVEWTRKAAGGRNNDDEREHGARSNKVQLLQYFAHSLLFHSDDRATIRSIQVILYLWLAPAAAKAGASPFFK